MGNVTGTKAVAEKPLEAKPVKKEEEARPPAPPVTAAPPPPPPAVSNGGHIIAAAPPPPVPPAPPVVETGRVSAMNPPLANVPRADVKMIQLNLTLEDRAALTRLLSLLANGA